MARTRRSRFGWALTVAVAVAVAGAMSANAGAAPDDEVELVGTVQGSHGDDFAADRALDEHYVLDTAYGPVRVTLPAGAALAPGQQVRLRGRLEGQTFVVAPGGVSARGNGRGNGGGGNGGGGSGGDGGSGDTTFPIAAAATKNVGVLLLNFSNDRRQPWTTSTVRGVVFDNANSVNAYYQDSSDGLIALSGAVHGWYEIASDNSGCRYTTWANEARTAATNAGVNLSVYQYLVYAWPSTSSCGWAGLAYLPGSSSFINGSMTLRVVAHELGHNFGVHHASARSCTSGSTRVTLSSSCTSSEYGDPFTVMGSASTRMHHNWHRAQLKYLDSIQTVTTSGDYALAPADSAGSPRLLRIPRSDGTYYNLEFRQPTGIFDNFSSTDPAVQGVTIRIAPNPTTITQSQLLDTTPETTTFSDAPLAQGRTFVDPFTGMQVSTLAVGSGGASVRVEFVPDGQPPTAPGNLTATAQSTSSIRLAWTASTDNVGVAGYRVRRGGTQVAEVTGTSFTDNGLAPATTYQYEVVAFDAAGNVGPAAQAAATTWTPDTQPPTAPANLQATVAKGGQVKLTWTASTDNVGVTGYRVRQNGTQVAQVTGTTATVKVRKGTYTFTVVAYDAAGNVSAPSNAVTVTA